MAIMMRTPEHGAARLHLAGQRCPARQPPGSVVAALALPLVAAAGCAKAASGPAPTPTEAQAVDVGGGLPSTDPKAKVWDTAPEHVAKLLLQDQTEPKLLEPAVSAMRVRALHDGTWIAFRLQWDDKTRDLLAEQGRSCDSVAVQIPVEAGGNVPDGAMGQRGRPVRIHLWKASWQTLLDSGGDPVALLYPNAHNDHYPYERAEPKARAEMETRYAPARAAGNPIGLPRRDSPVQDLVAEGFGTLTPLSEQTSLGRGSHDGERWTVTIARRLDRGEREALRAGARTYLALAVWDGGAGNTGSRKMRSGWIPLAVQVAR
jgi:hypothetical protein